MWLDQQNVFIFFFSFRFLWLSFGFFYPFPSVVYTCYRLREPTAHRLFLPTLDASQIPTPPLSPIAYRQVFITASISFVYFVTTVGFVIHHRRWRCSHGNNHLWSPPIITVCLPSQSTKLSGRQSSFFL